MANNIGSSPRYTSEKTTFHDGSRRYLKKIFIFLALSELLIIFICQLASKDSVIYIHLQNLNLAIYLPASISLSKTYTDTFKKPAFKAFKLFQRISGQDIISKSHGVNFTWLETNPVYSQFQIKEVKHKKRVTVLVIVSSAPRRVDRRQAIRETWWTQCKERNKVVPECIFMTDYQKKGDPYYKTLTLESEVNGDIYFQHVPGGITFGLRMLNHMTFALTHYDFDYFVRMDDDYFFCFEQFLQEVPSPMVTNFHWGWVHCIAGITRPEESMILFSNDVIQRFMKQDPNKILCHPWADQMIGAWSNEMNMTYLFRHDTRIHHVPIVSQEPSIRDIPNICNVYISVHGTYPKDMRLFWKHSSRGTAKNIETAKTLLDNSAVCQIRSPFDWSIFENLWRYEPKLCIENPTWDTSKQFVMGGAYSGREDENKRTH